LTLEDALRVFRARSFDLVIAQAAVASAEGDLLVASMIPNPAVIVSLSHIWNYRADGKAPVLGPCITCATNGPTLQISDQTALENLLTGKTALRRKVALAALSAAKMQRDNAQRALEFQLKTQYLQVLFAETSLSFARETLDFSSRMLELGRLRHPSMINDGQLARIEADKLTADRAVIAAQGMLEGEQAALAFLLGDTQPAFPYDLDPTTLRFRIPSKLASAAPTELLRTALERRPDLRAYRFQVTQADAQLASARRELLPDVALTLQYWEIGAAQNTVQPPMLIFGLQTTLPIFYQMDGEIRRAEASITSSSANVSRAITQVVLDVKLAFANWNAARRTVEVMEGSLLASSRRGRDVTEIQFREGSAPLIDLLDAERQFVQTNHLYIQDLQTYWRAVFALEQAVGIDLRN
jgi:cobalt-zinc-cadmium efflux system outer membrane protein